MVRCEYVACDRKATWFTTDGRYAACWRHANVEEMTTDDDDV